MKLLVDIILEDGGITIIPAGTHLISEEHNLPQIYDNLKQLNPGMTFYGEQPGTTVQFRSGGRIEADELLFSDIIPLEWRQAAQAEGYPDIIEFIRAAQLAPWEERPAGMEERS